MQIKCTCTLYKIGRCFSLPLSLLHRIFHVDRMNLAFEIGIRRKEWIAIMNERSMRMMLRRGHKCQFQILPQPNENERQAKRAKKRERKETNDVFVFIFIITLKCIRWCCWCIRHLPTIWSCVSNGILFIYIRMISNEFLNSFVFQHL